MGSDAAGVVVVGQVPEPLEAVAAAVARGQRVVLVGPNGAGKSTLLKLAAGAMPVQKGERLLGHNVKEGYYSQYRTEMLQMNRTVMEEALDTTARVRRVCSST